MAKAPRPSIADQLAGIAATRPREDLSTLSRDDVSTSPHEGMETRERENRIKGLSQPKGREWSVGTKLQEQEGGREALADTLESVDPFVLSPAEIVEKVLALGNAPDLGKSRDEMWPTKGRVYEVERSGQAFLVALSWEAKEISVQEVRDYEFGPTD